MVFFRIFFSVSQYYITLDIENTLSSPVTLNLKSNIADLDYQQNPSKMSYAINPSVDSQVLSFTFSTASENGFKGAISNFITFQGTSDQGVVLLNNEKSLNFDATKDRRTLRVKITFGNQYYIVLDVENPLKYLVTLNLRSTIQDFKYQREPSEISYVIQPSTSSQILSFTITTPFENGIISQFMTFRGVSQQGNVLLNGQKSLTFDAINEKTAQKVKVSFDDEDTDRGK